MKRFLTTVLFCVYLCSCAAHKNEIVMASFDDAKEYKKVLETTYNCKNVSITEVNAKGAHYFLVKYNK